jgi:hypothetical protein
MTRFVVGTNVTYRPRHTRRRAKPGRFTRALCLLALRLAL